MRTYGEWRFGLFVLRAMEPSRLSTLSGASGSAGTFGSTLGASRIAAGRDVTSNRSQISGSCQPTFINPIRLSASTVKLGSRHLNLRTSKRTPIKIPAVNAKPRTAKSGLVTKSAAAFMGFIKVTPGVS